MTSRAPSTRPQSTKAGRTTTSEAGDGDWVVACLEGRGVGREVGVVAIERDLNKVLVTQVDYLPTIFSSSQFQCLDKTILDETYSTSPCNSMPTLLLLSKLFTFSAPDLRA